MASALRGASQLFAEYVQTHTHLHKANTFVRAGMRGEKRKISGGCVHILAYANSLHKHTKPFRPFTKPSLVKPPAPIF